MYICAYAHLSLSICYVHIYIYIYILESSRALRARSILFLAKNPARAKRRAKFFTHLQGTISLARWLLSRCSHVCLSFSNWQWSVCLHQNENYFQLDFNPFLFWAVGQGPMEPHRTNLPVSCFSYFLSVSPPAPDRRRHRIGTLTEKTGFFR